MAVGQNEADTVGARMISKTTDFIEKGRIYGEIGTTFGNFILKSPFGSYLFIMSSKACDETWKEVGLPLPSFDHVSVSVGGADKQKRLPTWDEMNWVKDLFWDAEETAVQYHPKKSEYVNFNPWVLHLWSIPSEPYRLPPIETIGPMKGNYSS